MYVNMREQVSVELKTFLDAKVSEKKYSQTTADTYYYASLQIVDALSEKGPISSISSEYFEQFFKNNIKSKQELGKYKNAFKQLAQLYDLQVPDKSFFKELKLPKKREKHSSGMERTLINRKINALRNQKLKTAYRLAMISGLRVSELTELKAKDISIGSDIRISVWDGKGNKDREVVCLTDPYVKKHLAELLTVTPDEGKLFYAAATMKSKVNKLGFGCHDLRRIFAKDYLRHEKKEGQRKPDAKRNLKEQLGHARMYTTNRYLKNDF